MWGGVEVAVDAEDSEDEGDGGEAGEGVPVGGEGGGVEREEEAEDEGRLDEPGEPEGADGGVADCWVGWG